MQLTKFRFIWLSGFRGEDFQKLTNQKQELAVAAMFANKSEQQRTFHRWFLPSFGSVGHAVSKEMFQKSINQKQELPVVAMFVYGAILIEDLPQMLPTRFRFIWQSGFRGEDFQKSTNQEQELPVAAMFINKSEQIEQSLQRTFHRCFLPSFGSFGQAVSWENIFRCRPIRNKNCLW